MVTRAIALPRAGRINSWPTAVRAVLPSAEELGTYGPLTMDASGVHLSWPAPQIILMPPSLDVLS